jgi:hypothetical protein
MKTLSTLFASLALVCACTVGEPTDSSSDESAFEYLDTDGDGSYDAVDVNLDGIPDYTFDAALTDDAITTQGFCASPLVDVDGDGSYDGLDWNCDGVIDIPLSPPPAGGGSGGGTSGSSCKSTINDRTIECKSSGGEYECTCSEGGQVVLSCTTTSNSACSMPGNGNCCGF